MKKFLSCVKNESSKLLHRKKYLVFLLIGMAASFCNVIGKLLLYKISSGSINLSGSNTTMAMLSFFTSFWIPLISMMAVCDLFATEFQDSSMKAMLLRPVTRLKLYSAKIAAVSLLALCYLLLFYVSSALLDALLLEKAKSSGYAFFAYLWDLIPILIVIFMATFLNQLGKSSTMAMFLCIMIYILLYFAGILVPNLSGLLFTGYMKWHTLWLGLSLPFDALLSKIFLLTGYGLVFFSGGYYFFLKREL